MTGVQTCALPISNIASAYVQLRKRVDGADLGTFLVSQFLNDQAQIFMGAGPDETDTVDVDGTPFRLQLRYRRDYKPYSVTLTDVRRINYGASETPRDFSSYVTFTDTASSAQQDGRIWMNNPVRYKGETFYQSQYSQVELPDGTRGEMTGLQVVENAGWLIPYVACVLALWGMLAHFGGTFLRFADRYDRGLAGPLGLQPAGAAPLAERVGRRGTPRPSAWRPAVSAVDLVMPLLGFAVVGLVCLMATFDRSARRAGHDWRGAGTLPVLHEIGRAHV